MKKLKPMELFPSCTLTLYVPMGKINILAYRASKTC